MDIEPMDFEKEAREIVIERLGQPWGPTSYAALQEAISAALRRAFIAGQEVMRERVAEYVDFYSCASKKNVREIRSLPIQVLTNTSEGVK